VRKALEDGGLKKSQIDEVVFVGGSTRIPKIRKLISAYILFFCLLCQETHAKINPDEAVAYEAAVHAGIRGGAADSKELLSSVFWTLVTLVGLVPMFLCICKRTCQRRTYTDRPADETGHWPDILTDRRVSPEDPCIHMCSNTACVKAASRQVPMVSVVMAAHRFSGGANVAE